jgi:hypothetical protein
MTRTIPVDHAVSTASTAAPAPKTSAITVAARSSKMSASARDQHRCERVVEHPVDLRRDGAPKHEIVEGGHRSHLLVVSGPDSDTATGEDVPAQTDRVRGVTGATPRCVA